MSQQLAAIRPSEDTFERYADQFKALADPKRLKLMNVLCNSGQVCVCDLVTIMEMSQSKLSYHLKILMNAGLITREQKGTWNYYALNQNQVNHLLSEELCCLFRSGSC